MLKKTKKENKIKQNKIHVQMFENWIYEKLSIKRVMLYSYLCVDVEYEKGWKKTCFIYYGCC